jgi:hypothetical protein
MQNAWGDREQYTLKGSDNSATTTRATAVQQIAPQMDAENKRVNEMRKALSEADRLVVENDFVKATEILNNIIMDSKQYPEVLLGLIRSKISEINKLSIANKVQSLILQVTNALEENDYPKAKGSLNSIDSKLNSVPALHDDFSKSLGFLHYDVAKKYHQDKKKMTLHLERSKEFDNQKAKDAIKKLSRGKNPFSEEEPLNRHSLIYLLRNNPFSVCR